jgi:hypothetical protein
VGQLTDLTQLKVSTNQLTGTIPTEILNLRKLRLAWLHLNQFTGTVPDVVCNNVGPGLLEFLQADCLPVEDPPYNCQCCSACCNRDDGFCLLADSGLQSIRELCEDSRALQQDSTHFLLEVSGGCRGCPNDLVLSNQV